jgi:hypothetical protein
LPAFRRASPIEPPMRPVPMMKMRSVMAYP